MQTLIHYLENKKYNKIILAWFVCLTGALLFFYEFMQMNIFNSLSVFLMRDLHLDAKKLGILSSIYFYSNALLIFLAGVLLDKFSTRKLILFAISSCTLGTLIFSFVHTFWLAVICRFLVGIGGAFCFLGAVKLASRWFNATKMGLVIGVIVTMAMFGGMIAQAPFLALIKLLGWRQAIFVDGLIGIVFILLIFFIVKDYPHNYNMKQEIDLKQHLPLRRSIKNILLNIQNWYGAFFTCFMNAPVFILGAFIGDMYLHKIDGLSLIQASFVIQMIYIGTMFGSPLFGWISDYFTNRKIPMITGSICALLIISILITIHNISFIYLIILFFLLGLMTAAQVLGYPIVSEHNPKIFIGTSVSTVSMITVLSGGLLIPLTGWILVAYSPHNAINYSNAAYHDAILILPICFCIALLMAILIRETNCKTLEQRTKNV
mgnify:CR=1 FL=1